MSAGGGIDAAGVEGRDDRRGVLVSRTLGRLWGRSQNVRSVVGWSDKARWQQQSLAIRIAHPVEILDNRFLSHFNQVNHEPPTNVVGKGLLVLAAICD